MDEPWYAPRSPDEIVAYPWLHASAVEYLEGILRPDWRVLEHGAGGSTLWFAERVAHVTTIEHDTQWRTRVRELAPDNVEVLARYFEAPFLVGACTHDLFLIDGDRDSRGHFIESAHLYVKPGGWIVLDNANRPEYAKERAEMAKHAELKARFDNNVPFSLYFVTEFWKCASE